MGSFHAINLAGAVLSALMAAFVAVISYFEKDTEYVLVMLIAAAGLTCGAVLLAFAFYQNIRAFSGLGEQRFFSRLDIRIGLPLLSLTWPVLIFAGSALSQQDSLPLQLIFLPGLTVLGIMIPIVGVTWLAIHNLPKDSARRVWDMLALGMTLGPMVIVVFEIFSLLLLFVVVALVMSANPQWMAALQSMPDSVQNLSTSEAQALLQDIFSSPWTVLVGISWLSFLVPVVEEPLKVIGIWLLGGRIRTPGEGFLLGVLSGAGFAVFESLGASASGASQWLGTVGGRAGTSLLHTLNSGIMGWALVSAWQQRKYTRLGLAFLLTIFIHGLWNAAVVGYGLSLAFYEFPVRLPNYFSDPQPYLMILAALIGFMLMLAMGFNRALQPIPTAPVEYNQPLLNPDSGENQTDGNPDQPD